MKMAIGILLLACLAAGCGNGDSGRIAALEKKVAEQDKQIANILFTIDKIGEEELSMMKHINFLAQRVKEKAQRDLDAMK